jgi:hypothetical protein
MQYHPICGQFKMCSTKGIWMPIFKKCLAFPIDSIVIKDVEVQIFGGIIGLVQKWNKFK